MQSRFRRRFQRHTHSSHPLSKRSSSKWLLSAAAIQAIAFSAATAHAQTWISPSSGLWTNPLNWTTLPVSGTSTILTFAPSGTQSYVATDDFAGPFVLNQLVWRNVQRQHHRRGRVPLELPYRRRAPMIVMNAPGPVFIDGRINLTTDMQINAASSTGTLTLSGAITGSGNVAISDPTRTVVLNGASNFTGGVGASASIELGHQDALGSGTFTASGATLSTSINVVPSGTPPQRPIFSNPVTTTAQGLILGGKNGFTLSGPISGSGSVALRRTTLSTPPGR